MEPKNNPPETLSILEMLKRLKFSHFCMTLGGIILFFILSFSYITGSISKIKEAHSAEISYLRLEGEKSRFTTLYNRYLVSLYNFDRYSSFGSMDRDEMFKDLTRSEEALIDYIIEKYFNGSPSIMFEDVIIETNQGPLKYAELSYTDSPDESWLVTPYIRVEVLSRIDKLQRE